MFLIWNLSENALHVIKILTWKCEVEYVIMKAYHNKHMAGYFTHWIAMKLYELRITFQMIVSLNILILFSVTFKRMNMIKQHFIYSMCILVWISMHVFFLPLFLPLQSLDLITYVDFQFEGHTIPWRNPIDQSVVGLYIVAARWMILTQTTSKPLNHRLWMFLWLLL